MFGKCKMCGQRVGILNLTNGVCESCTVNGAHVAHSNAPELLARVDETEHKPGLLSGRSPRSHFWFVFLGACVLSFMFSSWAQNAEPEKVKSGAILFLVGWLPFFIVITIRRLNDLGASRWMTLVLFIPIANIAIVLFLLFSSAPQSVIRKELGYDK